MWRSGRVSDCKPESLGSLPGSAAFENFQLCRRSSTFVKGCQKSSIFIVKFSSGMSETFFGTCVNWSCVTRCGCRTTLSTLFTVSDVIFINFETFHIAIVWKGCFIVHLFGNAPICVSTVLECSCSRIQNNWFTPKIFCAGKLSYYTSWSSSVPLTQKCYITYCI